MAAILKQHRWRRFPSSALCSKRLQESSKLRVKLLVVSLPSTEVCCHAGLDFSCQPTLPLAAEKIFVEIEGNQSQHFLSSLTPQPLLLIEGNLDLIIHPPAR